MTTIEKILPPADAPLPPSLFVSDPTLEAQLQPTSDHYIGELEVPEDGDPYLPVRLAPTPGDRIYGWEDEGYEFIESSVLDKYRPDTLPIGYPITITEVVVSNTGTWVGFVYDDPSEPNEEDTNQSYSGRLVYTHAKYLRVKQSARPLPYVSKKIIPELEASSVALPGLDPVDPMLQNWLKLRPNDVRLSYYDFYHYNVETFGEKLTYTSNFIATNPVARYTEGHFYFILGELPRESEQEVVNSISDTGIAEEEQIEEGKKQSSYKTYSAIKQVAWDNLMDYLGKNTTGGNQQLRDELYENHFVLAASKVNTNSANPNNQKMLFAIRASYLDAIPDTRRLYSRDFAEDSEFYSGKNYAITLSLKDIEVICTEISNIFKKIKSKIKSSAKKVVNLDDSDYDLGIQIEVIEEFPKILNDFLIRQTYPGSTNQDFVSSLLKTGIKTSDDHLVQLGIKDNGLTGAGVRETVSYVLFSPDPKTLEDEESANFNLFHFDPFLEEDSQSPPRSAIALRIGLPRIREELAGIYGTRALHMILSYNNVKSILANERQALYDNWPEFLTRYCVPPLKIYLADDPAKVSKGKLNCDELIKRLNASGPNVGVEEKLIQEQIYNSPECMEKYFNQFKKDTPATSPELTKKGLEKKSEEMDPKKNDFSENEYFKILYTGFFNVLDPQALISLILACIQKKLGMPLTAEAICEAAIIQLLNSLGIEQIEKIMIVNAMLDIDNPSSQAVIEALGHAPNPAAAPKGAAYSTTVSGQPTGEYSKTAAGPGTVINNEGTTAFEYEIILVAGGTKSIEVAPGESYTLKPGEHTIHFTPILDESYQSAPIATAMAASADFNKDGVVTKEELEQYQKQITLIEIVKNLEKTGGFVSLVPAPGYQREVIDSERDRLLELGYTKKEADAILVNTGFLVLSEDINQNSERLDIGGLDLGPLGPVRTPSVIRAAEQDAQNWLAWMKRVVDLQGICELIVGSVLDGLQDLLTDPVGFLGNFGDGWWEDFVEKLKRQFSFPTPSMAFPDSLPTDSRMGDFYEQIFKSILAALSQMLGQMVQMVIREALDKCLEENDDLGPGPNPTTSRPTIPLPTLQRMNLPTINGVPDADIVAWMKDILDNLSTGQLCALLREDASKQTLYDCLERTKAFWPNVFENGVNTIYEIRVIFAKIGEELNLDICTVLQPSSPVIGDICDAAFDSDARCEELQKAGLTKEECEAQIEKELNDLKQKVLGLSELAFPSANPLGGMPTSPCAMGGSFQIPPGVEHTMSRVTDNMLDTLKRSLLDDLNALKFFSMPPRAILAANDPDEMKKAQQMFVDAVKNPFTVECLAFIGDVRSFETQDIISYGLSYNRYLHYGDHTTKGENITDSDIGEVLDGYFLEWQDKHNNPENLRESENLRPITIDAGYPFIETAIAHPLFDYQENFLYFSNWAASFEGATHAEKELGQKITDALQENIKPLNLHNLIYTPKMLRDFRGFGSIEGDWDSDSRLVPGIPSPQGPAGGHDAAQSKWNKNNNYLSNYYSLDTKLKDIHPDPLVWLVMLRNFTGILHSTSVGTLGDGFWDPGNQFWDQQANITPWSTYLTQSAGLRRLYEIQKSSKFESEIIARCFIELTVAEAIGLEDDRVKKLYPNLATPISSAEGVIFTRSWQMTSVLSWEKPLEGSPLPELTTQTWFSGTTESGDVGSNTTGLELPSFMPLYLVFKQVFRDPDSPLNASAGEMIDYFSLREEPVSPELLESLQTDSAYSNKDKYRYPRAFDANANSDNIFQAHSMMELYSNFNPNILLYDMPFTETIAAGLDGKAKTTEILDALSGKYSTNDQIGALLDSIKSSKSKETLLYQNVHPGISDKLAKLTSPPSDISTVVKAPIRRTSDDNIPPDPLSHGFTDPNGIAEESKIVNPRYNFNFGKRYSSDVEGLVNNIYGGKFNGLDSTVKNYQTIIPQSEEIKNEFIASGFMVDQAPSPDGPWKLDPYNHKAQTFGRLLTHKFMEKFNKYAVTSAEQAEIDSMEAALSTYCYSALQFAYSGQMFMKLKNSRLHKRKFMKKLWDKILKSPLNSSKVDPECQEVFDQLGITPQSDKDDVETDFFNLSEVKPKIMKMYKNTLCKDLYEGTQEESSVKKSLFNGVIKLIIKVYSLEMCLSGIISWDSFDISDIYRDDLMVKIIVKNIKKDFDIDIISYYANEVIKNELPEAQADLFLERSSLEYLIEKESKSIADTVKKIFKFGTPLSTDLKLNTVKNSNPDFVTQYQSRFGKYDPEDPNSFNPALRKGLFDQSRHEYVVDAELENNIYTMNYGGNKSELYNSAVATDNSAGDPFDLFGLKHHDRNKSRFHSLPMTFHPFINNDENIDLGAYKQLTVPYLGAGSATSEPLNDYKLEYIRKRNAQRNILGNADPFGKESFQEVLYGNDLNAKLGNITFQPYVRVEEISLDEASKYSVTKWIKGGQVTEPCEDASTITFDMSDYLDDMFEYFNSVRLDSGNIFGCHLYEYIPLSAWSYFYSNLFMEYLESVVDESTGLKPLKELYDEYGLKPFFKKVCYGLRMTYSTNALTHNSGFMNIIDRELSAPASTGPYANSLKKVKSLYSHRPHMSGLQDLEERRLSSELQIPIAEVEREIHSVERSQSFTLGNNKKLIPMSELGSYYSLKNSDIGSFNALSGNDAAMKFLVNNPQQFFYKNVAQGLLGEMKRTPEFRLLFDHLLPMQRYMAMAFLYSGEGMSKFIPEPTDVLDETKNSLKMMMETLLNADDYKYLPEPVKNAIPNLEMRKAGGTRGLESDVTKQMLMLLLKAPLLVLKGFVEATDPAVMLARKIVEITNTIAQTTFAAIDASLQAAKAAQDGIVSGAEASMMQLEMTAQFALSALGSLKNALPGELSNAVSLPEEGAPVADWEISIEDPPADALAGNEEEWEKFKESFNELSAMITDYKAFKSEYEIAKAKADEIQQDIQNVKEDAKEVFDSIFNSPYLVPGMWAAMLPSMIPFGGGIVPPPFFAGPPSTVPGMIYIALLLIDAIEEKTHDDTYTDDSPNCEEEL
jgi:hypothetical protein